MKLEPAVKKETVFVSVTSLVLCLILNLVWFILSISVEKVSYDFTVPLGSVYGTALSVGNFLLMAIGVQKAVETGEDAKKKMQLYYSGRMLLLAVSVALGAYLSCFHWLSVIVSVLFPRIAITIRSVMLKRHPEEQISENGGDSV